MANFAILHHDDAVQCHACRSNWDVELLMVGIGRARLRVNGFTFLWFDDDCIAVNTCPHCELPFFTRELFPDLPGLAPTFPALLAA